MFEITQATLKRHGAHTCRVVVRFMLLTFSSSWNTLLLYKCKRSLWFESLPCFISNFIRYRLLRLINVNKYELQITPKTLYFLLICSRMHLMQMLSWQSAKFAFPTNVKIYATLQRKTKTNFPGSKNFKFVHETKKVASVVISANNVMQLQDVTVRIE